MRPAFRHLSQGCRRGPVISKINDLGTCQKLQVGHFTDELLIWLSAIAWVDVGIFCAIPPRNTLNNKLLIKRDFLYFLEIPAQ
ncbi:hypothetical protein PS691_02626 [Pseudomonas fluorescens]|uniref:Uncharacterized protein n=1 Tax=Pseudomonas fluorescens TaxID=294 RepID=A0A5E7C9A6_PSEFL|nr:hypothetical protein PS691_02626 [Pseudomonas fluorescens]